MTIRTDRQRQIHSKWGSKRQEPSAGKRVERRARLKCDRIFALCTSISAYVYEQKTVEFPIPRIDRLNADASRFSDHRRPEGWHDFPV